MSNPIYANEPFLPNFNTFVKLLKQIWSSKQLTNFGNFHNEFENLLSKYTGNEHISLVSSATLGLIIALKSLDIKKGEVIVSPYGFIATTNALFWNNLKPVFVDIDEKNLNISAINIENAITKRTVAIMPTHLLGNPCDVYEIEKIGLRYNIPIIYDAAHAFGVKINQESIFNFGDFSIVSFHATKVFSTIEGGAIISKNKLQKERINLLRNNSIIFNNNHIIHGLNSKLNEIQAAFGIVSLSMINKNIKLRKNIAKKYIDAFQQINGINILTYSDNIEYNYSYFPIIIDKYLYGHSLEFLFHVFKQNNIYCKRYFYPLISDQLSLNYSLEIASGIANRILYTPINSTLTSNDVNKIISIVRNPKSYINNEKK